MDGVDTLRYTGELASVVCVKKLIFKCVCWLAGATYILIFTLCPDTATLLGIRTENKAPQVHQCGCVGSGVEETKIQSRKASLAHASNSMKAYQRHFDSMIN